METNNGPYPVSLTIDYPEGARNRASVFFRLVLVVPIAIVIALLIGSGWRWEAVRSGIGYASAGFVVAPALLMILFRQKYPRWWFDWNLALNRFIFRGSAYLALLRDEYPSTDEEQAVHLKIAYPDAKKDLNQWLPLVKWFLAIPHFFVLFFLGVAAWVCVVISWFAILFTGRYPKELAVFVAGVMRWGVRVAAYAFLLVTDVYPPFTLD